MPILWICGRFSDALNLGSWEFIGVFDSEELAIAACPTAEYFIGPSELNLRHSDDSEPWLGSYIPKQAKDETDVATDHHTA